MKKVLHFLILSGICSQLFAQRAGEEVTNLKINPQLYYTTKKYQPQHNTLKYLVGGNFVVDSLHNDTLPFIDDFSRNTEPDYKWLQNHIIDSFFNVVGGCLVNEGVATITGFFDTVPTWHYFYDYSHFTVDSFANQPILFTYFPPNPAGCLSGTPQTIVLWPPYYTYTFDSLGFATDSTFMPRDTISIIYAPVLYFAIGDTTPGKLWFDNYAYINNTFPIDPPTIGVATLDGLNEFGLPYNSADGASGQADYLTSLPFDLSPYTEADSLYLSFFFEPQGLGDYPDVGDSLVVEFLNDGGVWNVVWVDTGYGDPTTVPDTFQQVLIEVPTLAQPYNYFFNGFQFRFRNVVSLYGSNDLWHLDYVKFDKSRSATDTAIHDMAFIYPFPTILKNFTLEPAIQFNPPGDLVDTITLTVRNLDPDAFVGSGPATNFYENAIELYPTATPLINTLNQTFNAAPYDYIQIQPSSFNVSTSPNWPVDSLVMNAQVYITPGDSRSQNDTLNHTQSFTSVMAYDDGSAEKAYGLTGVGVKKFGYEFNLNRPDTLVAFQVMFTQIEANVANLVFNFNLWDTLVMNNYVWQDTPVVTMINQIPYYIDSTNGYTTYLLDSPLIVANKIYMGWSQDDTRRLQIGYDVNSQLGRPHMFVYLNGAWDSSTISVNGSPMIRLIFSGYPWWGQNSNAIKDLTKGKNTLSLFPNPTGGEVNLNSQPWGDDYRVEVFNMMGQSVALFPSVNTKFNIGNLANGVYIVTSTDQQSGIVYRNKIIKTSY